MRRVISIPLVIIAVLLTAISALLRWADREAFDTENVGATTASVIDDPAMRQFLATKLTDRIVVDLIGDEARRDVVEPAVRAQLADPAFQRTFATAVADTHRSLVSGDAAVIEFNLRETATAVRAQLIAASPALQRKIPDPNDALRFSLFRRAELPTVWRFAERAHDLATLVLVLGVALMLLALIVGPTRWTLLLLYGVGTASLALGLIAVVRSALRGLTGDQADTSATAAAKALSRPFLDSLTTQCFATAVAGGICALIGAALGVMGVGKSSKAPRAWSPPPSYRQNDWR